MLIPRHPDVALRAVLSRRCPQAKSPGAGPVIVLETAKGTIEFETYPDEAPKTVARIRRAGEEELLQRPALPSRRAELSRAGRRPDLARHVEGELVGPGRAAASRSASSEIRRSGGTCAARSPWRIPGNPDARRQPVLHPVAAAGRASTANTPFSAASSSGMDVADKMKRADVLKKASVKE